MERERIIAVGLLTGRDLERLGPSFARAYPIDETPCFGNLLAAIDDADRELWRDQDKDGDRMDCPATANVCFPLKADTGNCHCGSQSSKVGLFQANVRRAQWSASVGVKCPT